MTELGPLGDSEARALRAAMGDGDAFGPDDLRRIVERMKACVQEEVHMLTAGAGFGIGKVAKRLEELSQSSLLLMEAACRETSS